MIYIWLLIVYGEKVCEREGANEVEVGVFILDSLFVLGEITPRLLIAAPPRY